jgi:hypothetical protein
LTGIEKIGSVEITQKRGVPVYYEGVETTGKETQE